MVTAAKKSFFFTKISLRQLSGRNGRVNLSKKGDQVQYCLPKLFSNILSPRSRKIVYFSKANRETVKKLLKVGILFWASELKLVYILLLKYETQFTFFLIHSLICRAFMCLGDILSGFQYVCNGERAVEPRHLLLRFV